MLAVKILLDKRKRDKEFAKDLSKVVSTIKNEFNEQLSIINDSSCIEIVSGSSPMEKGEIVVELLVKKRISFNKESFGSDIEKEIKSFYKDKIWEYYANN